MWSFSRCRKLSGACRLFFSLGLLFAAACTVGKPPETPVGFGTPKPIVIQTLPATGTPTPLDTPDRPATQTEAARTATAGRADEQSTSAARTEFAADVLADIEEALHGVGEAMGYGAVLWLQPSPVEVESSDPSRIAFSPLDPSVQSDDFALHTVVQWRTRQGAGGVQCIVAFRMGGGIDADPWYSFRLSGGSGAGRVRFDLWRQGNVVGSGTWTETDAVRAEEGADNELILIARGSQFDAYVNGRQVRVWWNLELKRGGFGLGILQEAGSSVCSFRENWIWEWV